FESSEPPNGARSPRSVRGRSAGGTAREGGGEGGVDRPVHGPPGAGKNQPGGSPPEGGPPPGGALEGESEPGGALDSCRPFTTLSCQETMRENAHDRSNCRRMATLLETFAQATSLAPAMAATRRTIPGGIPGGSRRPDRCRPHHAGRERRREQCPLPPVHPGVDRIGLDQLLRTALDEQPDRAGLQHGFSPGPVR